MWWCTDAFHDERTNHVMTHHETYILFRTTVTIKTLHTMVCDVTFASKIIMLPMRTCQSWRMVTFQCIPIHTMTMTIAHDHTRVLEMTCHAPLRMIVTFHFFKNVQTVMILHRCSTWQVDAFNKRPNHALRNIAYDDMSMRRMHALNHMPDDCRTVWTPAPVRDCHYFTILIV